MLTALVRSRHLNLEGYLKLAIVAATLFFAAYWGRGSSITTLALLLAAVGGLVLFQKPELGLPGLLSGALCTAFTIGTGTQTPIHAVVILIPVLLLIWLIEMILAKQVQLVPSEVNKPLFAFVASVTISYLAGNLPWNLFAGRASLQSQTGGLMIFMLSAGVFLLMANRIKAMRWLELITWLFLGLGALETAGRWGIPGVVNLRNLIVVRDAEGSLLWVWLVALAGGQVLFNKHLSRTLRIALVVFIFAALSRAWLYNRVWVSGWLPPLVALWALAWLYSRRLGFMLTILIVAYLFWLKPDLVSSIAEMKQYSADTRLIAWEILLNDVFPASPIIGLGPANYYFYTPLYPILGYYVNFNSHNQYVDILLQTGIVGVLVLSWLMLAIAKVGWHLRERVQEGFARGYVYGCLAGLAGTLYAGAHGDWFLPFVYNIGLTGFRASMLGWLFLGGMIAVGQIATRHSANEATG